MRGVSRRARAVDLCTPSGAVGRLPSGLPSPAGRPNPNSPPPSASLACSPVSAGRKHDSSHSQANRCNVPEVVVEQCPSCGKSIGPLKLKKTLPTADRFTKFQVSTQHRFCFGPDRPRGFMPAAQFVPDKNGECRTTLNKVTAGKDGNEMKSALSVTLKQVAS